MSSERTNSLSYGFKREPRDHQRVDFYRFKDADRFALFWEMRLGKTKEIIDIVAYRYEAGDINSLFIVAPNGTHRDWVVEHLELDLPDRILRRAVSWSPKRTNSSTFQQQLDELLTFDGLSVLAVNPEALVRTEALRAFVSKFVRRRKVFMAIDESDLMKDPGVKITKTLLGLRNHGLIRAILTGTPASEGPLGLYSQLKFLDPAILGFDSFFAFKAFYAEYADGWTASGRRYPQLKRYRNIDDLTRKLELVASRRLRSECNDLPEKIYVKRRFDLTKPQRLVYEDLRQRYITELSSGDVVSASHVLARYTRLQQVASNFLPTEAGTVPCPACRGEDPECSVCFGYGLIVESARIVLVDSKENPRLTALVEELVDNVSTVIWCRFRWDVDAVVKTVKERGRRVVRYDGTVGRDDRAAAVTAFRDGSADTFVANLAVRRGGRGLNLSRAKKLIYYTNYFSLLIRDQSEARAEDLEATESTVIVDLIANDTVDDRIVEALRMKKSMSDLILGDDPTEWI